MAVLACQSLGLIDVGGIGSIEGDPQKYESPVNHLGLLGALQAAGGGDPTLEGLFLESTYRGNWQIVELRFE